MKIEIEMNNSYRANIKVDGKNFSYGYSDGGWSFSDEITGHEESNTLGGIVITKICDNLSEILQGWMPEYDSPDGDCWETWEELPEDISNDIDDRIF